MKVSIVLPAYNEEASFPEAVKEIASAAERYCEAFEIIAVNDGSSDGTGKQMQAAAAYMRQ